MSDLNSVIITGKAYVDKNKGDYMFVIVHKCWHENKVKKEKNIAVPVYFKGETLLKTAKAIKDGDQVRVVGDLDFDRFFLFIDAVQIEVKQ